MTYYKWLWAGRVSPTMGVQWPKPGVWLRAEGPLAVYQNGIHACREGDLIYYINEELWTIDLDPEMDEKNSQVASRAGCLLEQVTTWNDRTARLFAADCAERVLHLFEAAYPDDDRPRKAIETARAYANGLATAADLEAARSGATAASGVGEPDAAGIAAWTAASAAARTAEASPIAAAIQAAEWAAEWAADSIVRDTNQAWLIERQWQTARLLDYIEGRAG